MSVARARVVLAPPKGELTGLGVRPRRIPDEDAQRPEQLVPIRLEFDVEHHKMRDTFVWNLNGKRVRYDFSPLLTEA